VRSYPVVERHNLIFVWTGDPEKADPKLILDYPPLADAKWRGLPGYMHYKANWLLIVDNLSDFAHLAFGIPTRSAARKNMPTSPSLSRSKSWTTAFGSSAGT
jgi:phenylpropionate dioxygenase-like ring-hydroxylating dioxygenase large terminal subunit